MCGRRRRRLLPQRRRAETRWLRQLREGTESQCRRRRRCRVMLFSDLVFSGDTARGCKLRRNNNSSNLMVIIIAINLSGNNISSNRRRRSSFQRINRKRIKRSLRLKGPCLQQRLLQLLQILRIHHQHQHQLLYRNTNPSRNPSRRVLNHGQKLRHHRRERSILLRLRLSNLL